VDFGTTRVVVSAVDRGNYPVVSFDTPEGEARDWFPPVIAVRGPERRYGFEAWLSQEEPGWTVVRSVKRLLGDAGLDSRLQIAGQIVSVQTVIRELAQSIQSAIRERSTLSVLGHEPLEIMLGVPANANSNQRFLTAEGFRQAGMRVLGILNEPSAASIEFGHRARLVGDASRRRTVLVYDFGGGTFDASLVQLDDQVHEVIDSEGVATVGGDDFDETLADMALEGAGVAAADRDAVEGNVLFRLRELCRVHKEALHPNSRRIVLDLETVHPHWPSVTIPVSAYFERCQPLVDRTFAAIDSLIGRLDLGENHDGGRRRLESLYVIGGASELPIVTRRLKERYGRLVRRSSYGRSSTAIGLAIQADADAGYLLRDRFTRYFGVWREGDHGTTAIFDPLFARGTPLPGPGEPAVSATRTYRPAHNLGHFRFLECSQLAPWGQPAGDILHWDEIRFPFTPALSGRSDLSSVDVSHDEEAPRQTITETIACDASGSVIVTLANVTAGYSRSYPLGRWGPRAMPMTPARRRRDAEPPSRG
jgi:molecular chaperone DnaK (HSP70)